MKKRTENILLFFILLHPFLDLGSSLVRFGDFSITTILRPIIPLVILIYLFCIDKKIRKPLLIAGFVYILYAIIHGYLYYTNSTLFAYGSLLHEMQYVCNYTYLIFTTFIFGYVFYKKDDIRILNSLNYMIIIYLVLIYISLITNTSFSTYIEGIGSKGWFNTGGSLGAILVIALFVLLPFTIYKLEWKVLYKIIYMLLYVGFLLFGLGMRVGVYGAVMCFIYAIAAFLFVKYIPLFNFKNKILLLTFVSVAFIVLSTFLLNIDTARKQYLYNLSNVILNPDTHQPLHIALDIYKEVQNVNTDTLRERDMGKSQQLALIKLYNYAEENKISSVDLRRQQLIYHSYLWSDQKSVMMKLFGNGYLANMGALTLEMEAAALIFNFGIIGFLLYQAPFLAIGILGIIFAIRKMKKVDISFLMYLGACFISYIISFMAGHTYFNAATMVVIIVAHILLLNKILIIMKE